MKLKAKISIKQKQKNLNETYINSIIQCLAWFGWLCWFFSIGLAFFDFFGLFWFLCLSTCVCGWGVVCIQISVSGDCILDLGCAWDLL